MMSLHEIYMAWLVSFILGVSTWKWNKPLLVIVFLEVVALLSLGLLVMTSVQMGSLILILGFFVGEALIILSTLYISLRYAGKMYGSVSIF